MGNKTPGQIAFEAHEEAVCELMGIGIGELRSWDGAHPERDRIWEAVGLAVRSQLLLEQIAGLKRGLQGVLDDVTGDGVEGRPVDNG